MGGGKAHATGRAQERRRARGGQGRKEKGGAMKKAANRFAALEDGGKRVYCAGFSAGVWTGAGAAGAVCVGMSSMRTSRMVDSCVLEELEMRL